VFDALPSAFALWLENANLSLIAGSRNVQGYRDTAVPSLTLSTQEATLYGAAFFDNNIQSATDVWLRAARPDGSLYDRLSPLNRKIALSGENENFDDLIRSLRFERNVLLADNESRAVSAAHRVWQATGDDAWLREHFPVLESALEYLMAHPHRWSTELELPKRAFTLDSWSVPFKNSKKDHAEQAVGEGMWCVHPGDAARLHKACILMARMADTLKLIGTQWAERAAHIKAQLNTVGWNGQFYTHQIHLDGVRVRGVDESRQLAACNAIVLNSGLASREQCVAVLKEYQRRRELYSDSSFCEWWSIQPPFPQVAFDLTPGQSANGALWPSVGGELAQAAFESGFESYGVEILRRYHDLAVAPRRSFACYAPDGTPQREPDIGLPLGSTSYDVAGASAMLRALVEGVCGVRDDDRAFGKVILAPRWPATGAATAGVEISYAASSAYVSYRWALEGGRMTLDWDCKARGVKLHIMLPRGNTPERVALNGRTHPYALISIEKTKYVAFETDRKRGTVAITLK
jgi:hypothetical protein